jgi:glycosyltransferase involved in cell wall biosynthesis
MRIALIVPWGVGRSCCEGVIPVLLALIERLARRHNVLVIAVRQRQEWCRYSLLGATVINLGQVDGRGRPLTRVGRLRRLIANLHSEGGRFDVFHAFWVRASGSLATAAARELRVQAVVVSIGGGDLVWLPDIDYGGQRTVNGRAEASRVLRTTAAISGGSHYALRPCIDQHPDALWLPLGVERKPFCVPVKSPPGPPWRLLQVASISRVKDQPTLLRALRLVLLRNRDVQLDCIGMDTLGGSLQRTAAQMGLEGNVRFLGFKPFHELLPFYRQAHLFVQSSLHESMGAAVLEAAAAGVPTVGTAVGLVAELAPWAALAVPVRDPTALAEGILTLLRDQPQRSRLGHAAQHFARTHDADWTATQFEALYSTLLRRPQAGEVHMTRGVGAVPLR